jgi:hypothetical protein
VGLDAWVVVVVVVLALVVVVLVVLVGVLVDVVLVDVVLVVVGGIDQMSRGCGPPAPSTTSPPAVEPTATQTETDGHEMAVTPVTNAGIDSGVKAEDPDPVALSDSVRRIVTALVVRVAPTQQV